MENNEIRVRNLSHRYSIQWAVKDVSFDICGKGVTGLLGSNGAGKSTTMNIICGAINQTKGDVFINGIDMSKNPILGKMELGFLPQNPPLYKDLSVDEYLTHCAHLRFVNPKDIYNYVEEAKEKCSISHFSKRLIKNLSGGYQQRVGIAQAIVHKPKFIILDEPTNGLDPNQIVDIRGLIRDIAEEHCVLLSTHILSEVQALCSDIKMIDNGSLVFSGSMEQFDNHIQPESFIVEFINEVSSEDIKKTFGNLEISKIDNTSYRIWFNDDSSLTEKIIAHSHNSEWGFKELIVDRCSLEEIFAQLSMKK